MSDPASEPKRWRWPWRWPWRWTRGVLAILLAFLFVAIASGDAGTIVIDHSTTPPTLHIEGQFRDTLLAIAFASLPVVFIFVCMRKRWRAEIAGWIILTVLCISEMVH